MSNHSGDRCGLPHYDHPETVCTEPAGHYQPIVDPHAGPLILDGRHVGGAAWDEPKDTTMTEPTVREAGYLRDVFNILAAKSPVPIPTAEELTAGAAADKVTAERIHAARPGIPHHHVFNTLQALRAVRALDRVPTPDRADRIPLADLTPEDLAELYDDLDRYTEVVGELNETLTGQARDLAALREVARGYCPHCGRGDASPTVADWEQQKQRADQAETANERVRAECGRIDSAVRANPTNPDFDGAYLAAIRHVRAALDGDQSAPAKPREFRPYQPADIPRTGNPDHTLVIEPYRNDWREHVWAFRCWGTPTCDGWLSLDHSSQQSAEQARDRHVAEQHSEPAAPAATQTTDGSGSVSAPETEPNNREQP